MQNQTQRNMMSDIAKFYADPLAFVYYAYSWGEGELADFHGPDQWQKDFLSILGKNIKKNGFDGRTPCLPVQMGISSGHGIGKSALVAWLVNWIMATRPHCKGIVTANTAPQLETKTWAEIIKWTKRSITSEWFNFSSTKGAMRIYHKDHKESWRCDALTCKEENSESFAGQHAANSTPFYIFDEASAIPAAIWDVAEGGLTDGEPMWFAFGNPTRNSGRFYDCFHRLKHRWITQQIDSRTCALPNKEQIKLWKEDYGEESDFFKIRVRGLFPSSTHSQFIANTAISRAMDMKHNLPIDKKDLHSPMIIGVDVARFGHDETIIAFRKGQNGRITPPLHLKGIDTMHVASHVAQILSGTHPHCPSLPLPDAAFIDGIGIGAGVVDRLKQMGFNNIIDVNSAASPCDRRYANKRAEMYGRMRDWLNSNGLLPNLPTLSQELRSIEYKFDKNNRLLLESKDILRKKGIGSPDTADAYALTFAEAVAPKSFRELTGAQAPQQSYAHEYHPHEKA